MISKVRQVLICTVMCTSTFFNGGILTGGLSYSFGIFLPVYVTEFNASNAEIALIGSVSTFFAMIPSVYAGYLTDTWGPKKVLVIGTLLIPLGLYLASLSSVVWQLIMTQGLICGIGTCFAYASSVSTVGHWFKKKRGLALGIAGSGTGFGQLVMASIASSLLQNVGWRQTLQILALIELTVSSFAQFSFENFKPLKKRYP